MYISRQLLFNNMMINSRFAGTNIRSLVGSLFMSSCSRSFLASASSRSLHCHPVQYSPHHNHHWNVSPSRCGHVCTDSLPRLCRSTVSYSSTSSFHTSSRLSSSDLGGIASPSSKPDEPSVSEAAESTDTKPTAIPVNNTPHQSRLTITDRCRARLAAVLDPDEVLRIGVRGGGCSGFEYEISVVKADTVNPAEDIRFEDKVVVDSESIEFMNGAQLDYEEELIRSGFRVVNNPLAEKGCSCGASFSLKF